MSSKIALALVAFYGMFAHACPELIGKFGGKWPPGSTYTTTIEQKDCGELTRTWDLYKKDGTLDHQVKQLFRTDGSDNVVEMLDGPDVHATAVYDGDALIVKFDAPQKELGIRYVTHKIYLEAKDNPKADLLTYIELIDDDGAVLSKVTSRDSRMGN